MKKLMKLSLATVLLFGVSGCKNETNTSKDYEQLKQQGYWTIGLDDTFAPMGFRDEANNLVGFDIDLAREVSKRIGLEVKFQPIDWSMKETELNEGKIDAIWNGYSITDQRKEKVLFSDPYLENTQAIITLKDSPVKTKADLVGKTVSLQAESSAYDAVSQDTDFVNSLKDSQIIQYSTNNEVFEDLDAKRSDAIIVDEVMARYIMQQKDSNEYRFLEENFGLETYGVGMRLESKELQKQVNRALSTMKADKTFDTIKAKWLKEGSE